jgi:hypothetical protein
MKKKVVIFAVVLLVLFSICLLFWISGDFDPYWRERKSLAKELGVNTDEYSERWIPINYFNVVLKPGMSSEEVHQIVRGYEAVFLCDTNDEFYYYFSTDDDKADRFLIRYDEQGDVKRIEIEDEDSRSLTDRSARDCVPGRLGE